MLAGEIITELDLGTDVQVRALKPPSDIVPQLGLGDEHPALLADVLLSPYIEETRETQSRRGTEIVAAPDESELEGHGVMDSVGAVSDVFIEKLDVEDVLVIVGMEAVVDADERGIVDAVSAQPRGVAIETQAAVVFDLDTEIFGGTLLPEIKAACQLRVSHEGCVLGIIGMNGIVEVNEGEGRTPGIGVEELQRACYTR